MNKKGSSSFAYRNFSLGRAAATWQVATGLLTPAGALAGAALAETIGMRPTLWMLAIGIALAAAWLFASRRAIPGKERPAPAV